MRFLTETVVTLLLVYAVSGKTPAQEFTGVSNEVSSGQSFTAKELQQYYHWLPERIVGWKRIPRGEYQLPQQLPQRNFGGDRACLLTSSGYMQDGKLIGSAFHFNFEGETSQRILNKLSILLQHKFFYADYSFDKDNTIIPLVGSFFCCDKQAENGPEAFRVTREDEPKEISLRKASIVIPLKKKNTYSYNMMLETGSWHNARYDKTGIALIDYGVDVNNDHPYVKRLKIDYYTKDGIPEKDAPEEVRWFPNRKDVYHLYKIGDTMYFDTIGHTIINIVLPDTEDCRVVHRKNKDGTTTELKGSLIGWAELDPTPLPFDAEREKKTLIPEEQLRKEQEGTEKNEPVTRLHPVKTSAEK